MYLSKADKMLYDLGYEKTPIRYSNITFRKIPEITNYITSIEITFRLKDKEVEVNCLGDYGWGDYEDDLTEEENKAIKEKLKELGWLDE